MTRKNLRSEEKKLIMTEARMEGALRAKFLNLGDQIAKDHAYRHLDGLKAIHRYLIDKYRWLPREVEALTMEEIDLLLGDYKGKIG